MAGKIIVRTMNVGMCNQLFTYAYARYMAEKYNMELYLDYSHISEEDMKHQADYEHGLGHFALKQDGILLSRDEYDLAAGKAGQSFESLLNPWYIRKKNRLRRLLALEKNNNTRLINKGQILNLLVEREDPGPEQLNAEINIVYGYWQVPFYARSLESQLRTEIIQGSGVLERYPDYVEKLRSPESVCVHIRRGDYVGNGMHEVCTKQYYLEAMDLYRAKLRSPRFFIFSDDKSYAEKTFCSNTVDVELCDAAQSDYEELVLMSIPKYRVISNSSFSWWAQMLSGSRDVIAPSRWYGIADKKSCLYEDFWQVVQI